MARDPRDIETLAKILLEQGTRLEGNGKAEESLEGILIGVLECEWGTDASTKWKWGSEEVVRANLSIPHSRGPPFPTDSGTEREVCHSCHENGGTWRTCSVPTYESSRAQYAAL